MSTCSSTGKLYQPSLRLKDWTPGTVEVPKPGPIGTLLLNAAPAYAALHAAKVWAGVRFAPNIFVLGRKALSQLTGLVVPFPPGAGVSCVRLSAKLSVA